MRKASSENGVVRVVGEEGDGDEPAHIGMGILLTPRVILTCAHVVNDAVGRPTYATPEPEATLKVSFPILDDKDTFEARVTDWSPPGRSGLDCAILILAEDAPEEVGLAILSSVDADDVFDDRLSLYGSLGTGHPGAHVSAYLLGDVGAGWSQINVEGVGGVQPGFSGGAVWDRDQRAAIGMVVSRKDDAAGAVGYFLSAGRIAEAFPELPVEVRRVSLRRQRSFTGVALILFFLMLIHFMANRGSATADFVPWADESKVLAAFFGAHCFAIILGPYVMWHAYRHARSFAYRDWWQRVPAFSFSRRPDMLDNSRLGAAMTILFLLLLPAIAQGTFLREAFTDEGRVFVNVARFEPNRSPGAITCNPDDLKWCTHTEVGVWDFFLENPYFNHVYQIGEVGSGEITFKMVTFYPTLQPAILSAGTLLAYAWFFMFLFALWRPKPYLVEARDRAPDNDG
ncbi:MAG: serine protease [Pseudomonadota bacterium]